MGRSYLQGLPDHGQLGAIWDFHLQSCKAFSDFDDFIGQMRTPGQGGVEWEGKTLHTTLGGFTVLIFSLIYTDILNKSIAHFLVIPWDFSDSELPSLRA